VLATVAEGAFQAFGITGDVRVVAVLSCGPGLFEAGDSLLLEALSWKQE
jgi:hypothetical protein